MNPGTFIMNGGTISGNTAGFNGGGVYNNGTAFTISGSPKIENNIKGTGNPQGTGGVYLGSGKTITIDAAGLSAGARIGIENMTTTTAGTTVATGAAAASYLQYFYI